jgi:surface protein
MSIESELQRIVEAKQAMIQAIIDKGVIVPEDAKLEDLPALIEQIGPGPGPSPYTLPPNTLRFKFQDANYDPSTAQTYYDDTVGGDGTWTKVEGVEDNIWDWTYDNPCWGRDYDNNKSSPFQGAFTDSDNLVEIIDAGDTSSVIKTNEMFSYCFALKSVCWFDTSNVTDMSGMFEMDDNWGSLESIPLFDTSKNTDFSYFLCGCTDLIELPVFDTSNVTNMSSMLSYCSSIKHIPLFDTSKVIDVDYMCVGCSSVEDGAYELYQQMSSQTNPPTSHDGTFSDCGNNSQIPSDWK